MLFPFRKMYWTPAVLQFLEFFFEETFYKKNIRRRAPKFRTSFKNGLLKEFICKKNEKVTAKSFLNHLSVTSSKKLLRFFFQEHLRQKFCWD